VPQGGGTMQIEDIQLVVGKAKFSLTEVKENEAILKEIELFAEKMEALIDAPIPGFLKGKSLELRVKLKLDN
jgi:hypothetical protein